MQNNVLTDSHTEVQRFFFAKLKVHCPTAAVHSAIEPLHNKSVESHSATIIHKLPAPLTSFYHTKYTYMTFEQLQREWENIFANSGLGLQQQEAFYLEEATKLQTQSLLWHEHHKRRITASKFYAVQRASIDFPPASLIKESWKGSFMPHNSASISVGH